MKKPMPPESIGAQAKTQPIIPSGHADIEKKIAALIERYKTLDAKTEKLLKEVAWLKENTAISSNWQAVAIDKGGQFLLVAKPGDTDGDGYVSLKEATAAAQKFILDKNLGAHFKASALPTW